MTKARYQNLEFDVLVWLQTGFLGDIILTTAAMRLAQEYFPGIKQVLITTPLGKAALAGAVDAEIVVFDKRSSGRAAISAVKQELASKLGERMGAAVLLQAHRSGRSSLLRHWLGLPAITFRETSFGFSSPRSRTLARVDRVAVFHETARIGMLLEPLGVNREAILRADPALQATAQASTPAVQQLLGRQETLVAIAPGSVWGTKRWLESGFQALLHELVKDPRLHLLLLGSKAEASLTGRLMATVTSPEHRDRVTDLAGQTTLDDLRAIYPRLTVLVSNDSSPIHYASAFAVPTVAIFGATTPAMGFGPRARGSVVLGAELDCRPCSDHGPQTCPLGHFACMHQVQPSDVHRAVLGLLPS